MTKPAKFEGMPELERGDILLILREGMAFLTVPDHDRDDAVSADFQVALGIARAFGDPHFRSMMIGVMEQGIEAGDFSDIIAEREEERLQ